MKPASILFSLYCLILIHGKCEGQLSAGFAANIRNGCSPIVVNFSDQSTGSPSEWRWDLGNGTISTLQNPSATYFYPGFYTVKLWIRSGNRADSFTRTNYIQVFNSPSVDFGSNTSNGCNPLVVNFNDRSTASEGNIIARQWDFGDGILSDQPNPQHTYTSPGNFNVTLKVTSSNGCTGTLRRSSYIINNGVIAAFNNRSAGGCTPNKIFFQSESAGKGNLVYQWNFGDGTSSAEINPVHSYTNGGEYIVKLVVRNEFGCSDSISSNITVSPQVIAAFTADNTINCKAPATVNFTKQTTGADSYSWDFGDNTSSTSPNPSHVYKDTGVYAVRLIVKNTGGCTDSLRISGYIKVQKSYVKLMDLPDSGCIPFTKHFTANAYSPDGIASYTWRMGDGILLSGRTPVYTFNTAGSYNLSLVTITNNGCKDTTKVSNAIKAGHKPTARFSADIRNSCASTLISFTDESIGNITSWQWDFGDMSSAKEKNPTHVYKDTGWLTVQLVVSEGGCIDSAIYEAYVYTKPAVAIYKMDMDCSEPYKRAFTNLSLGADRWLWDFGDGTTSTELSPVHIFPARGEFSVSLQVWNDSTGCTYIKSKTIKISEVSPDFFADDTIVCKGRNVTFNASSDPDIVKYSWDFGDGSYLDKTSTPTAHAYKSPGVYSVKLTVKDALGCISSRTRSNYIIAKGPKAKFGVSASNVCLNTPVSFIDSSTANSAEPVIKWEWNYGDGTRDTLFASPFSHAYAAAGSYNPTVKITDRSGCTDTFRLAKPVLAGKIVSSFSISDSITCPGSNLNFSCPYNTPGVTYRWDFGDRGTSSVQSPVHSYSNEGVYTVKLCISKVNSCSDSTIIVNAVRVQRPKANFAISDSFSTCPPLLVRFTGSSSNAASEYWNFGDSTYTNTEDPSHYYTYPGEYKATVYAKGHGSCVDTMQKTIIIKGPKGNITSDRRLSCKPYEYNFVAHTENTVYYVWDFDDGVTQNGNDTLIRYTYRDSGNFVPKIILEDADGCKVPVPFRDTLVNIFTNPSFTFADSVACGNENIGFVNSSTTNDAAANFYWNFGDNTRSTEKNASHSYSSPGVYYPSLKMVTASGCSNIFYSAAPVKVSPSPSISMVTNGNGCAPLNALFNASSTDADASLLKWKWDMGNGNTSVLQNPLPEVYQTPGTYTINLSAVNSVGCSSTVRRSIQVYAVPQTSINGNSAVCRGNNLELYAAGAQKYTWSSSENLHCDTCVSITVQPLTNTRYILKGISAHGCERKDTLNVNVYQPVQLQYRTSANICAGQSTSLEVNGASQYRWSPARGLSDAVSPNPVASPDTTTNYTVIGSDMHGCFKDTGHIKVTVHKYPTVKACEDKTIAAGTPVLLNATYSSDVTQVYWSPTDNVSRYNPGSFIVKPTENTEYTVNVKNSGGCTASDKVTVFVTCNQKNVFMPNLFSPNNDGVNDVFYPRGTGLLKVKTLRIFNRWGEIVFEKKGFTANDPSAGWDGTYKGSRLLSDVFVYVMDLVCDNNSVLSFKGNVSLVL